MIFTKEVMIPLNTPEEYFNSSILQTQFKNSKIQNGLFILTYSDVEVQKFKNYWNLLKPLFDVVKIENSDYHLRWDGTPDSELYEFEFDSTTGHRLTFGFYQRMKEYDLYYYQNKNQPTHTEFIMGKTQNLLSSHRVKEIINLFQK